MNATDTPPTVGDLRPVDVLPPGAATHSIPGNEAVRGSVPTRLAVVFAILAFVLEGASLVFYSAAAGFAARLSVPPIVLLASGPNGARLIEWGSIVDMLGYLCMAPVVLYLRDRCARANLANLYAFAGMALIVIGCIGAVVMSTAAPYLIDQYHSSSSAARQSIDLVFGALYRGVVLGMWQTLETIPFAVWMIGNAIALRGKDSRALFWILLVIGLINAGIAVYRLSGL
jgi:hypothetical protein